MIFCKFAERKKMEVETCSGPKNKGTFQQSGKSGKNFSADQLQLHIASVVFTILCTLVCRDCSCKACKWCYVAQM